MKSSTSGSFNCSFEVSLDRPIRSIRLLQMDRTSEDRLRDKRPSSHATNSTNKLKVCMITYVKPRSGENLLLI